MAPIPLSRRQFLISAAATGAALGSASSLSRAQGSRTNYAVLVGVTDYPNLPKKYSLAGPKNDAALVHEFLTTRAPAKFLAGNVTVLAESAGNSGSPTLANITATLDALPGKVKPGDFVYIHLSGHGTQQPAIVQGSEPSGFDQVFMPADSNMMNRDTKTVPNALVDDEIGKRLDAIRNAGAFVWIVFDCCHSGTATRAASVADDDVTDRMIPSEALGFTEADMAAARTEDAIRGSETREASLKISPTGADAIGKGGMVAFFAAQNIEPTPEMKLPKGDPNATKLGLFTYTIYSMIAENPNVTYRQLAQRVMQAYVAANRTYPTPLFEGDLDKRIFDLNSDDFVQQWPIETKDGELSVAAGLLHRLTPGSKLAILGTSTADDKAAIGYLEVVSATNLTAKLRLASLTDDKPIQTAAIPAGAYARPVEVAMSFQLKVAKPEASTGFSGEVAEVASTLEAIVADTENGANVALVEPRASADLKLVVMSELDVAGLIEAASPTGTTADAELTAEPRLWLLPATAEISLEKGKRPPSILLSEASLPNLDGNLTSSLVKIYRSTALSRLSTGNTFGPDDIKVQFMLKRAGQGEMEPLQPNEVPFAHPDDQIHLVALNRTSNPVDMNILYVGSDYSISFIPPAVRLHPGQEEKRGILRFTALSFGRERMIAVLTDATSLTVVQDLAFLAQKGLPDIMRNSGGNPLVGLLTEMGIGRTMRSMVLLGETVESRGAVMAFELETRPLA